MKCFFSLLHTSWRIAALAVVAGVISGVSSAGLIALIHTLLSHSEPLAAIWLWRFIGLILIVIINAVCSYFLSAHLAEKTRANLRLNLSRRILVTPLRHLEEIGPARILATLTDDVSISKANNT